MSENFEYIDAFFQGTLPEADRENFLLRIKVEEEFAADVAFYLASRNALRQKVLETKVRRWEKEFGSESFRKPPIRFIDAVKKHWFLTSLAVLLLVAGMVWLALPPYTPSGLAKRYFAQHMRQMDSTISDDRPHFLDAMDHYNRHEFRKARDMFEAIAEKEPFNNDAIKCAGLGNMAVGQYNGAVYWFDIFYRQAGNQLAESEFLLTMALLSRNTKEDRERAIPILERLVTYTNVDHEAAALWLNAFGNKRDYPGKQLQAN